MEDEDIVFEVDHEISGEDDSKDVSEVEQELDPAHEMIDAIHDGNLRVAGEVFADMIGDKIQSAIEVERVAMGQKMFNKDESEE